MELLLFGGICTVGTSGTNSARLYYGSGNSSPIEVAKQTEVNSLKSSVSEGKSRIASAITDKGVSTSSTVTFQTMADNIREIKSSMLAVGERAEGVNLTISGTKVISAAISDSVIYVRLSIRFYADQANYGTYINMKTGTITCAHSGYNLSIGVIGQEIFGGYTQKIVLVRVGDQFEIKSTNASFDSRMSTYATCYR